jgi:hypothetical protein
MDRDPIAVVQVTEVLSTALARKYWEYLRGPVVVVAVVAAVGMSAANASVTARLRRNDAPKPISKKTKYWLEVLPLFAVRRNEDDLLVLLLLPLLLAMVCGCINISKCPCNYRTCWTYE